MRRCELYSNAEHFNVLSLTEKKLMFKKLEHGIVQYKIWENDLEKWQSATQRDVKHWMLKIYF